MNPHPAKLICVNFQSLEVRYRDPQPQVLGNYSCLFNLRSNSYKSCCLNCHFIPNNSDLIGKIKQIKNDYSRD